jgi:hypothetical protein
MKNVFGWDYPPGVSDRPVADTYDAKCPNGHQWEVNGTSSLGAFEANDEDDWTCPECGQPAGEEP